jgi:hypothetical protein
MPQITTVSLEARDRLVKRTPGFDARATYRQAIANLSADRALELEPDEGETLRKLKLNVARAAKETNRQVAYGESDSGTLLVWLEEARKPRRRRQARQPVTSGDQTAAQSETADGSEE